MKWTKRKPKEDGYYWLKDPAGAWATKIVEYVTFADTIYTCGESWRYHLDDFDGCLWAGPIPMPEKNVSIGKTRQQVDKNSPNRGK